jgi:hypothetical protein
LLARGLPQEELRRQMLIDNPARLYGFGGLARHLFYAPMAYIMRGVEFIETPTFTRLLADLLTDDEYAGLQNVLMEDPSSGDIIKGGGGIRKLRHAKTGQGKSGGVRIIYYWLRSDGQIYMLLIYPKSKKDDLTDRQTALLREFVKEL